MTELSLWSPELFRNPLISVEKESGALTEHDNALRGRWCEHCTDVAPRSPLLVHCRLWARFTTVFGDLSTLLHVTWDWQECQTRLHLLFRLYYQSSWRISWGCICNFPRAMSALFPYISWTHIQCWHQNQNGSKWRKWSWLHWHKKDISVPLKSDTPGQYFLSVKLIFFSVLKLFFPGCSKRLHEHWEKKKKGKIKRNSLK